MTDELHVEPLATTGDRSDFLSELIGEDGTQKGSVRVEITRTAATTWGLDSEDAVFDAALQLSKAIFAAGSPGMQVGTRFRFTSDAAGTLSEAIDRARTNPQAFQGVGKE